MFLKKTAFALSVFLIILTGCLYCGAFAENLLTNADFSQIGDDGLPDEWYTDAYISEPGYSVFSLSEGDNEHPLAVSIQNIGENDARFAQTVRVEPDTLYCLSGYIRAEDVEGGHGANLSIEGVYAFSDRCFDTEGDWEYIEYYGETGPDQNLLTVFARLGGYSGMSTGKASFAGLALKKAESVPDDGIADLWYVADFYDDTDDDYKGDETETGSSASFRIWLALIGLIYAVLAVYVISREHGRQKLPAREQVHTGPAAFAVLIISFILRLLISWLVEGYMVDVNCFLSWGSTFASVGPAGFYEATSFCDYPPLYTYILGLNLILSHLLGGSEQVSRLIFRLLPSLCDLAGCWMIYRLLLKSEEFDRRSCILFLALAAFNPALILNSAAWGQMDSVLCLMLACVALLAEKGKWKAALPLYVASVLIKPQALMLGPLGLVYLVILWIRNPESRKSILSGTGISLLTLAAGVIPFSLHQKWDWLIQLYARTLASYPYATVNTANIYYLAGGNWSPANNPAHFAVPVILALLTSGYGAWWYYRSRGMKYRKAETAISFVFAAVFAVFGFLRASWALIGATAMVFAFVIVISPAVRSRDIRLLPWLGGLLFILLYVFGVKMHERYVFPALLLLASAWYLRRDRRILYLIILFTVTVFVNEGIVLDNSIRLGSQMGHLNSDTIWLADIISILNISGAVYGVWLGLELFLPEKSSACTDAAAGRRPEWAGDRRLHWKRKDTILLALITAAYTFISLITLGSTKAPQTGWSSSSASEQIIFDLGGQRDDVEILYFAQVSRNDFTFSSSKDGEHWGEEVWSQMDQGQCWKWKYVTESYDAGDGTRTYFNSNENNIVRFNGQYIRLTAQQLGLKLNEILFRTEEGTVLPVTISGRIGAEPGSELYSDPESLIDEQDSMEGLPAFPQTEETKNEKIQPSWWNSTYFDEIYHARTAYEFLHGSVPYETSHPPLGKVLMSICVAIFGMTPFGWRFAGAVAGVLMLPGMYLIVRQLTKKTWPAVTSCLLMALDCMHLTQTQIATIDSFPVLFIIFAYFFMLRFLQTDFIREKLSTSLISLGFSGLFMGLSIASKWIGIYAGAGLAVLFFWHCIRMIRMHNNTESFIKQSALSDMHGETSDAAAAVRRTLVICAWCFLFFIAVPLFLYLVSYIPYMAYSKRIHSLWDYISEVWRAQVGMFNYHSTPNLGMDHPFYSPWWEWPVIGKPMYYASQQYLPEDYPVHHSIFAFGNPVIWFGGLLALPVCLIRSVSNRRYVAPDTDLHWHIRPFRDDTHYVFLFVGLLAQYLPWVLVPRGTYIYHYFATLPFLMASVCLSLDVQNRRGERICIIFASLLIAAAAVFFIILFPYASGMNVSPEWLNIGRNILRIWY